VPGNEGEMDILGCGGRGGGRGGIKIKKVFNEIFFHSLVDVIKLFTFVLYECL